MSRELIAIDIGNSRVKLGRFSIPSECLSAAQHKLLPLAKPLLPEPTETLAGTIEELESGLATDWLAEVSSEDTEIVIASVSQAITERLQTLMPLGARVIPTTEFPIVLNVDYPERLGADRAAAAVAANKLRRPNTPAIVIDIGTAITIDLLSVDGAFEGGAILPGPRLSAAALAEQTAALPRYDISDLDVAPDAVGRSTEPAILAGLYWGAVGALREVIARQRDRLTMPPQVFLTGGAAPSVARLIGQPDYTVRHVDHLTLAGIAIAAWEPSR